MRRSFAVFFALGSLALAVPALAQKDDPPGHGRGGPPGKSQGAGAGHGPKGSPSAAASPGGVAGAVVVPDRDRATIQGYYRTQYLAGNCPPGLAKKESGCLPPGQARKLWVIGQPLPAGVVYAPLPGVLLGQLGAPPLGYEYIRVANDILLMAVGTQLIVSAVADLGSL